MKAFEASACKQFDHVVSQRLAQQNQKQYVKTVIGEHERFADCKLAVEHSFLLARVKIHRSQLGADYQKDGQRGHQVAQGKHQEHECELELGEFSLLSFRDRFGVSFVHRGG